MFTFNNKEVKSINFNNNSLSKLLFNNAIVWKKNPLPDGYKECEYLESTGTQYIDTMIKCSTINYLNYEMEVRMQNLSKYTDENKYALIGAYEIGKVFQFGMNATGTSEERITMNMGFDSALSYTGLKLGEWRTLYASNEEQKMNDTVIGNKKSLNQFTDLTFYLFGRNGEGTLRSLCKERISYIYIKSNDKTILNLIPCLNNNGVPCMYDTVSKKTFYNNGAGEFLYKLKYPNLIIETKLGLPSASDTTIPINTAFPYSYYFNDILLEYGKKYKMTFYNKRVPSNIDDGTLRFRLINEDGTFYANCLRTDYEEYWNVESLEYVGNWYGMKEIIFTPKEKTHFVRIATQISSTYPSNFYLKNIEEVK